jgi:hypothetical protein
MVAFDFLLADGGMVSLGEGELEIDINGACEFANCGTGTTCASSSANSRCDAQSLACCLAFCDVSAPTCDVGETCASIGTSDPNEGLCTRP